MRAPAVIAGVIALAGAAVLALVGHWIQGTAREVARAEERAVGLGAPDPEAGVDGRGLGARIGESILGVADDRLLREAVGLARAASDPGLSERVAVSQRAQAEALLMRVARGDGDRLPRSRASNLLGALLFEDAKSARGNPRRYLELSLGAFQDAVMLDPENPDASFNLELLATLSPETRFRNETGPGSEASAAPPFEGGL